MTTTGRLRKYEGLLVGCLDGFAAPSDLMLGRDFLSGTAIFSPEESVAAAWRAVGGHIGKVAAVKAPQRPSWTGGSDLGAELAALGEQTSMLIARIRGIGSKGQRIGDDEPPTQAKVAALVEQLAETTELLSAYVALVQASKSRPQARPAASPAREAPDTAR